jgi:dTDP-4-dehydrorhamnose 3,5-epimerase
MKVIETSIPDIKIFEMDVYGDERGFFFESFNHKEFESAVGYQVEFVQDNHSSSSKGVLRGLHYQLPPHAQGKLVRCIAGEVLDVAVDIRRSSATFGHWVGVRLSAKNKRQLWIPEGFAHGFLTLSEQAEFLYKTTRYYAPGSDRSILWCDPEINIEWGGCSPVLSLKDQDALSFKKAVFFSE